MNKRDVMKGEPRTRVFNNVTQIIHAPICAVPIRATLPWLRHFCFGNRQSPPLVQKVVPDVFQIQTFFLHDLRRPFTCLCFSLLLEFAHDTPVQIHTYITSFLALETQLHAKYITCIGLYNIHRV